MIFNNRFDDLSEKEIELLNSYFDGYDYESCAYTFLAHYMWRDTHDLTWDIIEGYLCVAGGETDENGEKQYSMAFPLTKDGTYDVEKIKKTLCKSKHIFKEKNQDFALSLIPESLTHILKEAFGEDVELCHSRDDDDYIYLKEDLVTLKGRKLHQKKNHLNYFHNNYEFVYEEATESMVPEILEYVYSKNEYKLGETPEEWKEILEMENIAIRELLKYVGKGLLTGVIRIDDKIVAVTLGEFAKTNSKETVIVHVEKADDRIRGLYQAINNEFCKRLPQETVYVNREEDMGLENLRKTKLSYKPYKMAQKYTAVIKRDCFFG